MAEDDIGGFGIFDVLDDDVRAFHADHTSYLIDGCLFAEGDTIVVVPMKYDAKKYPEFVAYLIEEIQYLLCQPICPETLEMANWKHVFKRTLGGFIMPPAEEA